MKIAVICGSIPAAVARALSSMEHVELVYVEQPKDIRGLEFEFLAYNELVVPKLEAAPFYTDRTPDWRRKKYFGNRRR